MKKFVKENLNENWESWEGEFPTDTPADQGSRAARRDSNKELLNITKPNLFYIINKTMEKYGAIPENWRDFWYDLAKDLNDFNDLKS